MASQEKNTAQPFADIFDEDEAEKSFLLSKPTCFVVLGKPGSGKKTLARRLAQIWKCTFIEALEVTQENIREETEDGLKCQELLFRGQNVSEELVTKMILKKIESPQVAHFGYVLCGFPSLSEEYMTITQQIEKIKNLKLKPDFLINIKCSDFDLCKRLSGQRQHPDSGQLYQKQQWDPNVIEKLKKMKDERKEESEEEQEEQEEEVTAEDPFEMSRILPELVQRPEDIHENAEERVRIYRDIMLRPLEDLMAEQDSLYLIELDGNKQPNDLFASVVSRLQSMGVQNAAPITRLQSQQEETLEGLENEDELFRILSSCKLIANRFRWRRSRWGQACPVALKEGDIVMGIPDLAVSFLGKMYVLSSPEALKAFMLNPRPYLLPPMPLPPCKVLVFGPPLSGRTTVCNLIASKYHGKVLDIAKLIQPHMEEAREKKIMMQKDTIKTPPKAEKARFELEEGPQEQATADFQELTSDKEADGSEETVKSGEGIDLKENLTVVKSDTSQEAKESFLGMPEITSDHPEVQAMAEEAVESASESEITLSPEIYTEVLEGAIAELTKNNKDRFPGAPEKGGWVVDNYPLSVDHWSALSEKGLLPDTVVCLQNTEKNGTCLLHRLYLANKDEINAKILKRLTEEALKEKEEEEQERREIQEILKLEEEEKSLEAAEEREVEDHDEQPLPENNQSSERHSGDSADYKEDSKPREITLPEFPEDGFPDVPEMKVVKRKIDLFMHDWQTVESGISDSPLVQVAVLEIAEQSPESLLDQVVQVMEKPFKYHGWVLSAEDLDEEAEDLIAEGEAEEENESEEEENEDDEEEKRIEKKRHMGDTKHFCPVSLKENFVLYPGLSEHAAKYQEKIYYFSTSENRDKFLENPEEYVAHKEPIQAPPLRVCLLGTHGAGKTTCARWVANKIGIFHIQFEEYLQEIMIRKTKKRVGPDFDEEPEEDDIKIAALSQELEGFSLTATKTKTEPEHESEKKSEQRQKEIGDLQSELQIVSEEHMLSEIQLTDEEEAIKANLVENEALPPEVLDKIVLDWWRKEPFRSTGFILDGFPRTIDEALYLSERGLCPDIVVYIQVEESDILDRLFPPRMKKWRETHYKKMETKKKLKDLKAKIRDKKIARRRAELLTEHKKKKQEEYDETSENENENEDENEDIEAVLEEEFLEEEEEETEEEHESDALERIRNEIAEKFELERDHLQGVQEEFERMLIPQTEIGGERKPHIVRYRIYRTLNPLVENRSSIFEKCYPISLPLAHKMLIFSYKYPSSFGQWDPVKLSEGDIIKSPQSHQNPAYPVIHRQYIYFLSTKENKEKFMKNPIKYICQPKPKPAMPIKIAVLGPPKSGKTTVAKKFASTYGFLRLTVGDAIRLVLNEQPESELALVIKWHLHKGLTVPDELAVQALDVTLMNHMCTTAGVVIDGYPLTRKQVNLLESVRIIPVKIFELEIDAKEVFRRALSDKENANRYPYPEHDSSQILAIRNSCYKQHIDSIRTYYEKEHQNWCVIDAFHSKWWIWNKLLQEVQVVVKEIQIYLERIREGKAASIADLCITPEELQYRLGEFGQYCPVSLAEKHELRDCSVTSSLQFAAEFRGHYYKMASQEELEKFLNEPELYVPPLAPHPLPPPEMLPKKLTVAEVKALFPISAEMQGYCPVTYLDGKQRYEALVPGNIEYAAKYRDKVYIFESEEKLQKFMRLPEKYWNVKLPHKLPPVKEPILLTALPLAGYLEQGVATSLIKALNEVGCLKPKFPFLSVKRTALLFVAYHLKAFNPRSPERARRKYRRELEQFAERCALIPYLGAQMPRRYREPRGAPADLDRKLRAFLALQHAPAAFP